MRVNYSGLLIAGVGFFLTRFTVTLALYEQPVRFIFAGVVPLSLGLGLAAFGVALAVAEVDPEFVRTTAIWCVIGAATMFILVVLTLLGSSAGGPIDLASVQSRAYLSNFLIGGSIGGTLTGLYSAGNRRHRDATQQQANRLQVLNRLLRHEVLNAVTVIQGYATERSLDADEARTVIADQSADIERTIEAVNHLARDRHRRLSSSRVVELTPHIDRSVATIKERYPAATVTVETPATDLAVRAARGFDRALTQLLENAIVHGNDDTPIIEVTVDPTEVAIAVTDTGPGLPDRQRRLLETGAIERFDDPSSGFGLNLVRLFVDDSNGRIETATGPDGATVTLVVPRPFEASLATPLPTRTGRVRPALPTLLVTLVAALLAGVAYGLASEWLGGSIAGIGVFYGTASPLVGWLTHEFHSVVFALVFTALVSVAPSRLREHSLGPVAIGLGWATVLWLVAASFIAPIWLRLLGIPAAIPNLDAVLFVSHLVWGVSLGLLTAWGDTHVTPVLSRAIDSVHKWRAAA